MLKKGIFTLLLLIVGSVMFVSSARHWRDDPLRKYATVKADVINHRVSLNWERWKGDTPEAMELATTIRVADSTSGAEREMVVRAFMTRGEDAWDHASSEPSGSSISLLLSPDHSTVTRADQVEKGPIIGMVVGILILLAAVVIHFPKVASPLALIGIWAFFCIAGIVSAWEMWPSVVTHVKAAEWSLVPFEVIGQRTIPSGKNTRQEVALRYTYNGTSYENVIDQPSWGFEVDRKGKNRCRGNPASPWQVALSWGWRPGLGVALFPMPFLAIGFLGAYIAACQLFRPEMADFRLFSRQPSAIDWTDVIGSGFALLFVGSIVGVFVSICAEQWIHQDAMRWFLTPFLIPFVWIVLKMVRKFIGNLWAALR